MKGRARKFLSYYKPYLGLFLGDMACAAIVAGISLVLPLCARYITGNVLEGVDEHTLQQVYGMGVVMLLLVGVHTACNLFVDYRGHLMGAMMEGDMRGELFEHYQRLSFGFYDERRTGELMSRITNDLLSLAELYHHGPEDLLIALVTLVGVFAIAFTLNAELTLIVFLVVPAMTAYAFYFNKRMIAALTRTRERIADINSQVEETLGGIRVVKSFANEPLESSKFDYENVRFLESRGNAYRNEAFFSAGMIAFTQLITIAVIVFGGVGIATESLSLPDLLAFLLYVGILTDPIRRLVNFARLYQEGISGFIRLMDMLEVMPEIQDRPGAIDLSSVQGSIEFEDVSFRYSDQAGDVLRQLDLKIDAGEYVALVGASGVGKTTLCALIPRFYDINSGRILLDGIDIRDIRQAELRRHIGVVQQDLYLYSGTVAENIRYGRPDADDEDVMEAARQADAHDFIARLPAGYETRVGQRGVRLSGGQKQRLSIARVFLKNPPVIIFDEATSALDNESESAIQKSLERLTRNRTMLVIAHRLSTVKNADRILVLTEDGIIEQGSHESLIAADGSYARLYNMQLRI